MLLLSSLMHIHYCSVRAKSDACNVSSICWSSVCKRFWMSTSWDAVASEFCEESQPSTSSIGDFRTPCEDDVSIRFRGEEIPFTAKSGLFLCPHNECDSQFKQYLSLKKHLMRVHEWTQADVKELAECTSNRTKKLSCSCGISFSTWEARKDHFRKDHGDSIENFAVNTLCFETLELFQQWKRNQELETKTKFMILSRLAQKSTLFVCNRQHVQKRPQMPSLQERGHSRNVSRKTEVFCPVYIKMEPDFKGRIRVEAQLAHNHSLQRYPNLKTSALINEHIGMKRTLNMPGTTIPVTLRRIEPEMSKDRLDEKDFPKIETKRILPIDSETQEDDKNIPKIETKTSSIPVENCLLEDALDIKNIIKIENIEDDASQSTTIQPLLYEEPTRRFLVKFQKEASSTKSDSEDDLIDFDAPEYTTR